MSLNCQLFPSPSKEASLLSNYDIQKTIGEGTFGKVKLAVHIPTKEYVAIKILEKKKIEDEEELLRITREIKYLKYFHHRNIIQIYEILENEKTFYIIMEYADKGELFSHITTKKQLEESEASFFYAQIITGIEYIHKNRIAHRDLKPENILMTEGGILKLIDFGLSNKYQVGQLLATACGSPCYASPEMILGQRYKGELSDIWSSGVILFAMVCGYLPFEDENNEIIYQQVLGGIRELPQHLSPGCKDLIRKILTVNPGKRIDLKEIKAHLFLQEGFERYNAMIVQETNDNEDNSNQVPMFSDEVIDKMLLMPSSLLNSNNNKEETDKAKRIIDVYDKQTLIREISNTKYTQLTMTYKLLNYQWMRRRKSNNNKDDSNNCIINSSPSETTILQTPTANINEDNSSSRDSNQNKRNDREDKDKSTDKDQDKANDDTTPKQSETVLFDIHKNTIQGTNINEEIQDSIENKVLSHSFKNSFIASKRKQSETKSNENNNNSTACHNNNIIKPREVPNALSSSIDYLPQQDTRAVSLEVSAIIKKNQMNSNVILGKSALNPLYNIAKNKNKKFKRNNMITQYLASVSLTNRIDSLNQIIDSSVSLTEESKEKTKSSKNKKVFRSSYIPLNTINLDETPIKKTLTAVLNQTTLPNKDNNNKRNANRSHKRSKSARLEDEVFGLNRNTKIDLSGKGEKPHDNSLTKHELGRRKGKEMKLLQKYQPSFSNRIRYNQKIPKKTAHLSIIDSEALYITNKETTQGAKQSSMECKGLSILTNQSRDKTDKVYQATEVLKNSNNVNRNNNKSNRTTTHYRNLNQSKSPIAEMEDKRKVITPISFIPSKQFFVSHYNIPINQTATTTATTTSTTTATTTATAPNNTQPNLNNIKPTTSTVSSKTSSNPISHYPKTILSPKANKPKKTFINSKAKSKISVTGAKGVSNTNRNQKLKESNYGIATSVKLNMKTFKSDFAVCSTKSSLIEIKEKLCLISNESGYAIKEIDLMHFICHKGNDNEIVIEILRIESKNVIKIYNYKENDANKELIKKIIIHVGF